MMSFLTRFRRSRRGATAVALAIMFVPMVIAASAAVDISRAVSAHTQLQAAADAAAIAGAGAWQTSESSTVAQNTTTVAFTGTGQKLSNFISGGTPTVELTCTGSTTQCGGTAAYATSTSTYNCPATSEYCVVVTSSGTMHNSLFAWLIPSTLLNVTSIASASFPAQTISGKNIPPSPGFGSAGDVSGIYAYAVPMSGGTPNYTKTPTPNAACNNYSSIGPLALLSSSSVAGTTCNYLFIALSTSSGTAGTGGSITLQQNQPISFSFINYTGANGYHSSNYYQTNTQLYVSTTKGQTGTYYANGFQAPIYTTKTYTCFGGDSDTVCPTNVKASSSTVSSTGTAGTNSSCSGPYYNYYGQEYYDCTTTVVTFSQSPSLTGECPDSTLYGSLDPLGTVSSSNASGVSSAGVPEVDSLNPFSSAYEVEGYPPTYEANHALVPFVATTLQTQSKSYGKKTYYITAICPNYETSGTDVAGNNYNTTISAPISSTYSADTGWTNLNIFSTAFPGQNYGDSSSTNAAAVGTVNPAVDNTGRYASGSVSMTSNTGDIYPPAIAGCTPAGNTSDGGVTTSPSAWWNWHGSNTGNCGNESGANQGAFVSTPGQAQFSNCNLVIQDLGNAVPTNGNNQALLPDYYLLVRNPAGAIVGLDPIWDGQSFPDVMGGVITNNLNGLNPNITVVGSTVYDGDVAATYNSSGGLVTYGFTPPSNGSYTLTSGPYSGDTVYYETPAARGGGVVDFDLPPDTSNTCYNPQDNGNAANTVALQNGTTDKNGNSTPTTFTTTGDQNNGSPVDPVANPQLGAILCSAAKPHTYALYWNDLGTYGSDDLGYWNAIIAFTCSTPSSTAAGGGPITLSG